MGSSIQVLSTVTCPHCGHQAKEEMPKNACQYFWNCPDCEAMIKPKHGDCCVFCSYGNQDCHLTHEENYAAGKESIVHIINRIKS